MVENKTEKGDKDAKNGDWTNYGFFIIIIFFREPIKNQTKNSVWRKQTFFIIRLIFYY